MPGAWGFGVEAMALHCMPGAWGFSVEAMALHCMPGAWGFSVEAMALHCVSGALCSPCGCSRFTHAGMDPGSAAVHAFLGPGCAAWVCAKAAVLMGLHKSRSAYGCA